MASSMLTGDRRWAATRKLTVLGKVPKPINLPSQRLENHGLDPNVEIVPKGTLTWGSRPSTPVLNAWGTSSCSSPLTDGSVGSPSHRPSSGGGTRPSTAGSDRSHEPVSNAWGPNSRPSSASGVLTSNKISTTATRPRSADTRPGSSQLSRFADNSTDSTVAWGTAGTAEKLGTASSKSSEFTLSFGDFPSLGSDKNSDTHSLRGHSSQGRPQSSQGRPQSSQGRPQSSQGRPSSACGADSRPKEFFEIHGSMNTDHFEHGTVNTWKVENCQYAGHGVSPNIDNWHRDPHRVPSYPNMNMPPTHHDSWHNPPFHPADGAWYRGGEPGGPYRPPGPLGTYPIDYPHASARPLSNSQQFPRQDAGPGGFYPNNCKPYRPYMPPERYMGPSHPDVPVRPGAYQGPVPYEGYFGPPHPNFYNSLERETSIMGMAQPVVHNQYATKHQNYDPANFHARSGECASVMNKEQAKPHQANEAQGPYKVLLKQHEGSEDCNETDKMEHPVTAGIAHLEQGKLPGVSSHMGDWGTKSQTQEPVVSPSLPGEAVSSWATSGVDVQCTDTVVRNSLVNSSKVADDGLMRGSEALNITRGLQQYPVIKKKAPLMEKVESLNNKARIADSHIEDGPTSCSEKPTCFKDVIAGADRFDKVASPNDSYVDNTASTPNMGSAMPTDLNALAEDKNQEAITDAKVLLSPTNSAGAGENSSFLGQKKAHVAKNVDYHGKSRSNRHDNDVWMKKAPGSESSINTSVTGAKDAILETDAPHETSEKQELLHAARGRDAARTLSSVDPVDQKAQRAKMREIAMQRAKQLQHEEEERTREQKAKALAKLEELNRRTLAESSNLTPPLQSSDGLNTKSESGHGAAPTADATSFDSNPISVCNSESVKQVDDCGSENLGHSIDLSSTGAAQASCSVTQSSEVPQAHSLPMEQESDITTKILPETTSDIQHNAISKQKQVGYRKKHSNIQDNSSSGKQKHSSSIRSPTDTNEIVVHAPSSDTLPNMEYPPVQHKKRNNRSSRNNNTNKLAEGLTSSTSPSPPNTAVSSESICTESGKIETSTLVEKAVLVHCESSNENVGSVSSCEVQDVSVNQGLPDSTEGTHGRGNNHWKPHLQRKTSRNQQPNKPVSKYHATEAVMWAPVKPLCKNEAVDEVSHNSVTEPTKPNGKSGNDMHNGLKAKRAEIERYVPKPVAKELSQLVNSQHALIQQASGDTAGKSEISLPSTCSVDGPAVGKASAPSDTRNGENLKHNKSGKANASWRQRVSAESPATEGSGASNQAKTVQKACDQLQTSIIVDLPEGQLRHPDDGWNDNNDNVLPGESVDSTVVGKSYGSNRQRRQPHKVHRVTGSNHHASENMGSQQGVTDRDEHPSPAWGHTESEGRNSARCVGVENTKPHWQPKSQAYNHGQTGNWGNKGAQRTVWQGPENALAKNEATNTSDQGTNVSEASDALHHESRRERKVTAEPAKEHTGKLAHPDTGHQRDRPVPSGGNLPAKEQTGKLAHPDAGHQRDRPDPSGGNLRGQHYGRFHRGYDPSYRGRDYGQENYKQDNGDKRRSNQHVEYQGIGSYDKTGDTFQQNPNAGKGAHEPLRAPGTRYRDRGGQHFPRGGGGGQFYGRSSGTAACVSDSYNGGE